MRNLMLWSLASLLVLATSAAGLIAPTPDGPEPAASASKCDDLNTICATSSAAAGVDCSRVDLITIQCTGSAVVGGAGSSPQGLPGSVAWTGAASCTGDCAEPVSGSAAGAAAWPGLGVNAAGSEAVIVLGTVTKQLIGCLSMTVTADADATAQTFVPLPVPLPLPPGLPGVTLTSVAAPHTQDVVTGGICLP